jgi:hypothetical protein
MMIAKFVPGMVTVVGIPLLMTTTSVGLYRSALIAAAVAFAAHFLLRAYKYY